MPTNNQNPEQVARDHIDRQLKACGWVVQNKKEINIVQEIESRLSVCDKLEETLAAARKQAEVLRQSLLQQAFAGKLVAPILNADGISA